MTCRMYWISRSHSSCYEPRSCLRILYGTEPHIVKEWRIWRNFNRPSPSLGSAKRCLSRNTSLTLSRTLIEGGLSDWRAVGLWTHEYLASTYQDKRVIVGSSIEETRDGSSPAIESGFWIKNTEEEMDFRSAIELITGAKQTRRHYYLWRRSIPHEYPEIYSDITIPPWVPIPQPRINLWVGGANHVTNCHYDIENNFFAQVHGQKHFTIYAPDDTRYLYPPQIDSPDSKHEPCGYRQP